MGANYLPVGVDVAFYQGVVVGVGERGYFERKGALDEEVEDHAKRKNVGDSAVIDLIRSDFWCYI